MGKIKRCSGFTLLEILIAVVILGVSLVTLLSLQSSVLTQEIRERERQQALGVARRILSAIEFKGSGLSPGVTNQDARNLLSFLLNNQIPQDDITDTALNVQTELKVTPIGIPKVAETGLQKIELAVIWGESSLDRIDLLYVITDEPQEVPSDDSEEEGTGGEGG